MSPAITINKKKIIVYNTCAFDCLLTAIAISYIEYPSFREFVDVVDKDNNFLALCKEVSCHGANKEVYKKRGIILSALVSVQELYHGIFQMKSEMNVCHFTQHVMFNTPSSIEQHICDTCSTLTTINNPLIIINYKTIFQYGFSELESTIHEYLKPLSSNCTKCNDGTKKSITKKLTTHILIEVDWYMDKLLSKKYGPNNGTCTVADFPTTMEFNNKR